MSDVFERLTLAQRDVLLSKKAGKPGLMDAAKHALDLKLHPPKSRQTLGGRLSAAVASPARRRAEAMRASRIMHETALKAPMGATSQAEQAEKARKLASEVYGRTYKKPTPYRSPISREDGKLKPRSPLPEHVRETMKDYRVERAAGVANKPDLPREQWGENVRRARAEAKEIEAPKRKLRQIEAGSATGGKEVAVRGGEVARRTPKEVPAAPKRVRPVDREAGDRETLTRAGQSFQRDQAFNDAMGDVKDAAKRRATQAAVVGGGAATVAAALKIAAGHAAKVREAERIARAVNAARPVATAATQSARTTGISRGGALALAGGGVIGGGVGAAIGAKTDSKNSSVSKGNNLIDTAIGNLHLPKASAPVLKVLY